MERQVNTRNMEDIRDKHSLNHKDILELNFIRSPGKYYYRRHFKMGLRSHIMEVLRPKEINKERFGTQMDGMIYFPRAIPVKILRLFRTKFACIDEAIQEIQRVKIIEQYLGNSFMAQSEEFLVHYSLKNHYELLLCGLQVYVRGEPLDPWSPVPTLPFRELLARMMPGPVNPGGPPENLISRAQKQLKEFIHRIKKMVIDSGYIPDLAGVGNILLTVNGDIMLVDINNISKVFFTDQICLDDRGYPVCDKSVQALYLLEKKLTGTSPDRDQPVYRIFMDEQRIERVRELEHRFHSSKNNHIPA